MDLNLFGIDKENIKVTLCFEENLYVVLQLFRCGVNLTMLCKKSYQLHVRVLVTKLRGPVTILCLFILAAGA